MKKILIMIVLACVLLLPTACSNTEKEVQETDAPKEDIKQTIDVFGIVKATETKNIMIEFPATIETVNVKEGQKVSIGTDLVTLNIDDYMAQITDKEIELESDKSDLERISKELEVKRNYLNNNDDPEIKKLLNDLKNAENLYKTSSEELISKQELFNNNAISQSELSDFEKEVNEKQKAVEDIKYSLDSLKFEKQLEIDELIASSDTKKTKIVLLESEINLMKTKLNKDYIKDNNIISDINNGLVYDIGYQQGDYVEDSTVKLLSLMNLDSLIVEADVAEEFIKDVKIDANVTILPLADKSREYTGRVKSISDKAAQSDGETNVTIEIAIDNIDEFLRPEYNVDIEIEMPESDKN